MAQRFHQQAYRRPHDQHLGPGIQASFQSLDNLAEHIGTAGTPALNQAERAPSADPRQCARGTVCRP